MKPEEIAAYIGAAAWLPQIASWIYRRVVRPSVRIVPNQYAEAGFTSLGPICNLRMAILVDNKDVVIDGMEMVLRHEDGDSRILRWAGLGETFSEITDAAGNKQVVSRDQSPIAIKVGTESLLEKFVRFQEPRYHEGDRPLIQTLVGHFNYLKQGKPDAYVAETLASKELFSLLEARRKAFWWKPGRYDIEIQLSSPQKFSVASGKFRFDLTASDVQLLQKNVSTMEADLRNIVSSNLPDFQAQPVNWNWANVDVLRANDA
ncbi:MULTISPECIES: hypothetical protein [unclassified Roseateles]|uniref:hypothetical protein n=1 Tax=unclassified Roseateles TaxID=2626991 RepID=UPI0012E3EEE6|nr:MULTISPECIES: hypothetical protein [unclassified Roseateles]